MNLSIAQEIENNCNKCQKVLFVFNYEVKRPISGHQRNTFPTVEDSIRRWMAALKTLSEIRILLLRKIFSSPMSLRLEGLLYLLYVAFFYSLVSIPSCPIVTMRFRCPEGSMKLFEVDYMLFLPPKSRVKRPKNDPLHILEINLGSKELPILFVPAHLFKVLGEPKLDIGLVWVGIIVLDSIDLRQQFLDAPFKAVVGVIHNSLQSLNALSVVNLRELH